MHFLWEHFKSKHKELNTKKFCIQSQKLSMFWQNTWYKKKQSLMQCLAYFFLYLNVFANTCIKNTKSNLFYQYMLLLTKVKQFSNLLKIKKEIGVLIALLVRYTDGCPESMRSRYKLLKNKQFFFFFYFNSSLNDNLEIAMQQIFA